MENIVHVELNDEMLKKYPALIDKKNFKEVFFLKEDDNYHKKGTMIAVVQKGGDKLVCWPEYENMFGDEYDIDRTY